MLLTVIVVSVFLILPWLSGGLNEEKRRLEALGFNCESGNIVEIQAFGNESNEESEDSEKFLQAITESDIGNDEVMACKHEDEEDVFISISKQIYRDQLIYVASDFVCQEIKRT